MGFLRCCAWDYGAEESGAKRRCTRRCRMCRRRKRRKMPQSTSSSCKQTIQCVIYLSSVRLHQFSISSAEYVCCVLFLYNKECLPLMCYLFQTYTSAYFLFM